MPVSTDDYLQVLDHIGRYCWAVDSGDGDAWSRLFTQDGAFAGFTDEPVVGHAALRLIPIDAYQRSEGTMCHLAGNIVCDYGETPDTIVARLYNQVTTWVAGQGGRNFVMAKCRMTLVRHDGGWLINRNEIQLLSGN